MVTFFGTTKDDFHSFGSFPLAIDILNSLVVAGAMLCEVDLSILADVPSGPFDLETSNDPNIKNLFFCTKEVWWT